MLPFINELSTCVYVTHVLQTIALLRPVNNDQLRDKETYYAQFQRAARTRHCGHFDGGFRNNPKQASTSGLFAGFTPPLSPGNERHSARPRSRGQAGLRSTQVRSPEDIGVPQPFKISVDQSIRFRACVSEYAGEAFPRGKHYFNREMVNRGYPRWMPLDESIHINLGCDPRGLHVEAFCLTSSHYHIFSVCCHSS